MDLGVCVPASYSDLIVQNAACSIVLELVVQFDLIPFSHVDRASVCGWQAPVNLFIHYPCRLFYANHNRIHSLSLMAELLMPSRLLLMSLPIISGPIRKPFPYLQQFLKFSVVLALAFVRMS